jgi:hypothetical protein
MPWAGTEYVCLRTRKKKKKKKKRDNPAKCVNEDKTVRTP